MNSLFTGYLQAEQNIEPVSSYFACVLITVHLSKILIVHNLVRNEGVKASQPSHKSTRAAATTATKAHALRCTILSLLAAPGITGTAVLLPDRGVLVAIAVPNVAVDSLYALRGRLWVLSATSHGVEVLEVAGDVV